ncbi:hypothetical protein EJ06DRAFT_133868 [Trichodelitschia bisporula]|uniref:Uncharacterized protein n=1 Tax=Trichodelitschia bisporula TaxID=703511 RepID=A0A6G1HPC2_9PEZI|nr:hypothetical protein EJ06DRAFT_133868 [Trichodelitschia bisporula]
MFSLERFVPCSPLVGVLFHYSQAPGITLEGRLPNPPVARFHSACGTVTKGAPLFGNRRLSTHHPPLSAHHSHLSHYRPPLTARRSVLPTPHPPRLDAEERGAEIAKRISPK